MTAVLACIHFNNELAALIEVLADLLEHAPPPQRPEAHTTPILATSPPGQPDSA